MGTSETATISRRPTIPGLDGREGCMAERREGPRARGERHGKRRRRSRGWIDDLWRDDERSAVSEPEALADLDESLLSEDERAYRAARRLADQKVALARRAFGAALITVPLLIFVPIPLGLIALIYFGVGLGRRAFRVFYEPGLRERFVQEEVQRRVRTRVHDERRNLEGEHHRSLEQLSASIAHEIRNPITAAKSLVQQMGEDAGDVDQEEYARVAVAELERVERSISHLLRFAREEEARVVDVRLEDVLESALETFRDRAVRAGIAIERRYESEGHLAGDPEQLRRVVINLVSNAIDALEESGVEAPQITVEMGGNLAATEVWLRIADNGIGIDAKTRERIFDPFYTSREDGTGLGLALCRKIVDAHHGSIEVDSEPGEGTVFLLTFPRARGVEGAS